MSDTMSKESLKERVETEQAPSKGLAEDKATQTETTERSETTENIHTGADKKDVPIDDRKDVKKILSCLEDMLSPLSHLSTVAYYTTLNCLFAVNLWVVVSVYRLF